MELIVLCGLQASGKSTFRREWFPGHVVVSKDLMRNNRHRERRQQKLVAEGLGAGASVVVDNTNPAVADRQPLVVLARRHGAAAVAYFFDTDFETCLRRNAGRSGKELVPYVGLVDVARRLQPPRLDEGFDEVWLVRADSGRFAVTPLSPEQRP